MTKESIYIQDENVRAAGPLLLSYGSALASIVAGAIAGDLTSGVVAAPLVGWMAIEAVYASGPAFLDWILARLRPRASRLEEDTLYKAMYRRAREDAAETAKVDETPRRVDLSAEYSAPTYEPMRPKWTPEQRAKMKGEEIIQ